MNESIRKIGAGFILGTIAALLVIAAFLGGCARQGYCDFDSGIGMLINYYACGATP